MFRRTNPIPMSLRASDLAGEVSSRELRAIERRGTTVHFPEGRAAMSTGEIGRECLVVVSGSFAVERGGEGVAVLQPGMVMGEVALLTMKPRNATVTALEDSTAYAFNRGEFVALLDECPRLAEIVRAGAMDRSPAS